MNENPKTNPAESPRALRLGAWIILFLVTFAVTAVVVVQERRSTDIVTSLLFTSLFSALVSLCLWLCFRWLSPWLAWRRLFFGLACLLTLIALFYAEEDWRGWHAWNQFRHHWEAQGEHFDLLSAAPPPVPDDQNFAMTPLLVSSYGFMIDPTGHQIVPSKPNWVNRLAMEYSAPGHTPPETNGDWTIGRKTDFSALQHYYQTLPATTNLFPVPAQPQSPAADVLFALSKFAPTIEELRQDAQLPDSRFPLEYGKDDPAAILLPHLASVKRAGIVLQLRVLAELQTGQNDQSFADLKLLQRLTDSIRTEPILISQLVRISMTRLMVQAVWEGLADHRWTDPQLAELDSDLASLDFFTAYKLAMHGELGLQSGVIHYLHEHPREYVRMFDNLSDDADGFFTQSLPATLLRLHLVPNGWFHQNELTCARTMMEYGLPAADLPTRTFLPDVVRRGLAHIENEVRHPNAYNLIALRVLPALGNAVQKFAFVQSSTDLARVAIALERYRLAHGKYPDTLAALEPQFLNPVPHDVIGGQPLHYRLPPDNQFILYSIGWNETDDGGTVALRKSSKGRIDPPNRQDIQRGDWVWRYPAP